MGIEECGNYNPNMSLDDTLSPCDDCWNKALDAIEEWTEEHTDELLGDKL